MACHLTGLTLAAILSSPTAKSLILMESALHRSGFERCQATRGDKRRRALIGH